MYEAFMTSIERGSGGECVPVAGPARRCCVRRESGAQFVRRPSSAIAQFACRPLQLLTHSTANALTCHRPAPHTTPPFTAHYKLIHTQLQTKLEPLRVPTRSSHKNIR